jgi:hypothetical protein
MLIPGNRGAECRLYVNGSKKQRIDGRKTQLALPRIIFSEKFEYRFAVEACLLFCFCSACRQGLAQEGIGCVGLSCIYLQWLRPWPNLLFLRLFENRSP